MTNLPSRSGNRPVDRPSLIAVLPLMMSSTSWAYSLLLLAPIAALTPLTILGIAAPTVVSRSMTFALSLPLLGWLAWGCENTSIRVLAFLKTLPLAVSPKSMTLAPLCAVAVLVVALALVAFPMGVADGAAVLALSWWAFVAGRWLAPGRPWLAALAIPFICWLPLVPAELTAKSHGDWPGTAVCAAFALLAARG